MLIPQRLLRALATGLLLSLICAGSLLAGPNPQPDQAPAHPLHPPPSASQAVRYVLLGWNDLGMHCYNRDFSNLGVLPPYNTLWAQVVKVGDPPQIVTAGITVSYSFPDNTSSANKSNFWNTIPGSNPPVQIAQKLFGLPAPLPPNIGLTGKGLAGALDPKGDHFEAVGIPLTEYRDQDISNPDPMQWPRYPYQKAQIVVRDAGGNILTQNTVVAPVSTEMRCDKCHSDGQRDGIATGKVETNILTFHDREEGTHLMSQQPVLCASCHASNALGARGNPNLPSLSNAMHRKHAEEANIPATTDGCYDCHPGPQTQCLRDVMSQSSSRLTCINCHGTLTQVAQNPSPWLHEPKCSNCHPQQQNAALYRMSTGHGGIRCEACHDSTHAIARSREPNDAIKFINLQGHSGTLGTCTVCHLTQPAGPFVHNTLTNWGILPLITR